jgi:hypothetical protein
MTTVLIAGLVIAALAVIVWLARRREPDDAELERRRRTAEDRLRDRADREERRRVRRLEDRDDERRP